MDGTPGILATFGQHGKRFTMFGVLSSFGFGDDGNPGTVAFPGQHGTRSHIFFTISLPESSAGLYCAGSKHMA